MRGAAEGSLAVRSLLAVGQEKSEVWSSPAWPTGSKRTATGAAQYGG
jgi:hypothetical protein